MPALGMDGPGFTCQVQARPSQRCLLPLERVKVLSAPPNRPAWGKTLGCGFGIRQTQIFKNFTDI